MSGLYDKRKSSGFGLIGILVLFVVGVVLVQSGVILPFKGISGLSMEKENLDATSKKSIEEFFLGYSVFRDISKVAISENKVKDYSKVQTLLRESRAHLLKCDILLLNETYVGWGDIVSKKMLVAIDLQLSATQDGLGEAKYGQADKLIQDADTWLSANWDKLTHKLHDKYGYEIK